MIKRADISHNTSILRPACWGLRRQTRFISSSCLCAHASVYVHNWFHLIALPRSGNLRWSRETNRKAKRGQMHPLPASPWQQKRVPPEPRSSVGFCSRAAMFENQFYVCVCVCVCVYVCVGVSNCNWHGVFYFENSRKLYLNVNYDDLINEKGRIAEDKKSLQPREILI